eukprot:GHVQ01023186.1.p1 GENE.GHVQ01023186.1~~GHVQ01023186.1.p1  ORF type:complete len:198 (-),score=19.74 GHVQ01023186.1:196-789(-)
MINQPSQDLFVYRVLPSDTLVGVAVKFKTSVASLMFCNKLTCSDIWFKKELLIPAAGSLETTAHDDMLARQADESAKTAYMVNILQIEDSLARQELRKHHFDVDAALQACETALNVAKIRKVSVADVLEGATNRDSGSIEGHLRDTVSPVLYGRVVGELPDIHTASVRTEFPERKLKTNLGGVRKRKDAREERTRLL